MTPLTKLFLVRRLSGITSTQKNILMILCSHIGKNECCFISYDTLLEETCLINRISLRDNINALIQMNYLEKKPPSNGFKSNRYSIKFDQIKYSINERERQIKDLEKIKREKKNAIQRKYREEKKKKKKEIKAIYEEYRRDTGGVS